MRILIIAIKIKYKLNINNKYEIAIKYHPNVNYKSGFIINCVKTVVNKVAMNTKCSFVYSI